MVRDSCSEKIRLRKGPWTIQEDQLLLSHIHRYGPGNWRELPKHAGLLRCGKSCRLRWVNYLRPDIRRGNFTKEEEETIVQLHQIVGNRWSSIAGRLPGRTDNEIKNYWHTRLKKRIKQISNVAVAESKEVAIKNEAKAIAGEQVSFCSAQTPMLLQVQAPEEASTSSGFAWKMDNCFVDVGEMDLFDLSCVDKSDLQTAKPSNADVDMEFWYKLFMEAENSITVRRDLE